MWTALYNIWLSRVSIPSFWYYQGWLPGFRYIFSTSAGLFVVPLQPKPFFKGLFKLLRWPSWPLFESLIHITCQRTGVRHPQDLASGIFDRNRSLSDQDDPCINGLWGKLGRFWGILWGSLWDCGSFHVFWPVVRPNAWWLLWWTLIQIYGQGWNLVRSV